MNRIKKTAILFIIPVIIAGLIFASCAVRLSRTEKILIRANERFTMRQYKEAYEEINRALALNSTSDFIPVNVLLLAEPIYFSYLQKIAQDKEYVALEDVESKLFQYPQVESARINELIMKTVRAHNLGHDVQIAYSGRSVQESTFERLISGFVGKVSGQKKEGAFALAILCLTVLLVLTFLFVILILTIQSAKKARLLQKGSGRIVDVYAFSNKMRSSLLTLVEECETLGDKIDEITGRKNHSRNVAELVYKIAFSLGITGEKAVIFYCAALVFDAGFLSFPKELLCSKSFGDDEKQLIKSHVEKSCEYFSFVPSEYKDIFLDAARKHHENMDGSGYPEGISGEKIPLVSRIIRVCESYVSIVSLRLYREIRDKESAISELEKKGDIYDSEIVACLRSIL